MEQIKTEKEGFFKNEDHLDMQLDSDGSFPAVHFHLDGQDCRQWHTQVSKVKAGDYENDRIAAIPEEVKEKIRKASSVCPTCGGVTSQPVLRGMDSMECGYCGFVIRL
ncbi:MAG: hypothetical protein C0391_07700 [Anaerolinea sp.]|nr:hypothetical protein [Anaerolinea sp.]